MKNKIKNHVMSNLALYVFILILAAAYLAFLLSLEKVSVTFHTESGPVVVGAEAADDRTEQTIGLSGRDSLEEGAGMLFVFPDDDKYVFWMKGMKFPLDIIFISQNLTVTDVYTDLQPCTDNCSFIIPRFPVKYALEVSAGYAGEKNIAVGTSVSIGYI